MIKLENVCKSYPSPRGAVHALQDVSLTIEAGDFVAVRGSSGSGKSTLLALISGLATPTSGSIVVGDVEVSKLSAGERAQFRAEQIGFVFQMFHLLPYLNVVDNVLAAANNGANHRGRALQLLEDFGLGDRLTHRPGQLSAGERQRVAMARALLNQPRVLLADEPTGNLDVANADAVLGLLDQFREAGGTIVLATHDERAAARADRSLELSRGQLAPA